MSDTLDTSSSHGLAAALERGEVVHYPATPFRLPEGDDRAFLLRQRQATLGHKSISYNPATRQAAGFIRQGDPEQAERLAEVFAGFSQAVTQWLNRTFPFYREGLKLDRVSFGPQEEATRSSRTTARNDLLHIDAFPNRPTHGDRILRVYANLNPSDPRVWVTSDPFADLLRRYGKSAGLPGEYRESFFSLLKEQVRRFIKPQGGIRSEYDSFMLRFHDHLKRNGPFQQYCAKTIWHFLPGAVWLVMTDACSHAVLRGRFALEHSYFVSRPALVVPDEAPIAILERFCAAQRRETPVLQRAA